jgi:hypothetical protein
MQRRMESIYKLIEISTNCLSSPSSDDDKPEIFSLLFIILIQFPCSYGAAFFSIDFHCLTILSEWEQRSLLLLVLHHRRRRHECVCVYLPIETGIVGLDVAELQRWRYGVVVEIGL